MFDELARALEGEVVVRFDAVGEALAEGSVSGIKNVVEVAGGAPGLTASAPCGR